VCKVAFEDLIGENGGGSHERQLASIRGVLDHLGAGEDAEALAAKIYNESSFTFFKGRTGAWREQLDEECRELAERRFAGVLDDYGYL
jgi:hypothetical protein